MWVDPLVGKIPWRRKWQPTSIFLAGEFHAQRNMVDCSPWSHTELKQLSMKMTTGTGLTKLGAPEGVMYDHGFVFAPFHAACLLLGAQDIYGWN